MYKIISQLSCEVVVIHINFSVSVQTSSAFSLFDHDVDDCACETGVRGEAIDFGTAMWKLEPHGQAFDVQHHNFFSDLFMAIAHELP